MQNYLSTTWRLWKLLKPFHKEFYLQVFLSLLTQAGNVLRVLIMVRILNSIVANSFYEAYLYSLYYFLATIALQIFSYITDSISVKKIDYNIQQHLQNITFERIFKLNASQYIEDHSAVKMQVIDRGEHAIEIIIKTLLTNTIPTVIQIIFYLMAIFYFSPIIALVTGISFLLGIIWTSRVIRKLRPLIAEDRDNWDKQRRERSETFQHLNLVKIFAVQNNFLINYLNSRMDVLAYSIMITMRRLNHGYTRSFFMITVRLLTIVILVRSASLGNISVGAIYAVWSYMGDIYGNITNLLSTIREMPIRFVELEKYLRIIDKQPDFEEEGAGKFVSGDIVFKDLNFKYPKSEGSVLKNLSLTIPQGKKVAFVGVSGSGKSTIIKLLLRMYNYQEGSLSVNGVELKDMSASDLRHHIGYVEQHVDLFDTTVRENLLFGLTDKNVGEEFLNEVVEKARIDQFFHRLSKGLETQIGERGVKLSGGERQRVGIARALIKNPEILIFDEATASLDTENEKYIQEAIDEASRDRTSIIIAHRLSTIQNADVIFVMHRGELVGSGTHQELLQNNEYYQNLTKHQS